VSNELRNAWALRRWVLYLAWRSARRRCLWRWLTRDLPRILDDDYPAANMSD
jgi:hypothetical protein